MFGNITNTAPFGTKNQTNARITRGALICSFDTGKQNFKLYGIDISAEGNLQLPVIDKSLHKPTLVKIIKSNSWKLVRKFLAVKGRKP
jgi:hypothetical protein